MCDINSLDKCGPEGITVADLDNAWMDYCDKNMNIFSEDCKNFYEKNINAEDSEGLTEEYIKLNEKKKEEKELTTKINSCKRNNFSTDDCARFANTNTTMQTDLLVTCAKSDEQSKNICTALCNNPLSTDILKQITCGDNYLFVILIIVVCIITSVIAFKVFIPKLSKKKENSTVAKKTS